MSRKRPKDESGDKKPPKKPYPSRAKVSYISLPKAYREALAEYARQHSTPDDKKSVAWAARVLLGPRLRELGLLLGNKKSQEELDEECEEEAEEES